MAIADEGRQVGTLSAMAPGRRAQVAAVAVAALAASMLSAGASSASAPSHPMGPSVLVTGADGVSAVADAVRAAGGRVVARLDLAGGVEARLPAGTVLPAGMLVTPDREVTFASGVPDATGAVSTVRETLGLSKSGNEGSGVTVAVVDTGVADVPDLAGRVVDHVDVTGTGGGDGFGHGTFMAGLIAGSGDSSKGAYRGVAPAARILDVKVADAEGTTSLSDVLRGLEVVGRRGNAYGVDVLNLSLSSGSPAPYQVDPLNQALAALWHRGVTVVTPSGNDGPAAGSVSSPGNDPRLLTVGALDEQGTASHRDDTVAEFSGRGPTNQGVAKPDLVAPGSSVVAVKSPGSVIDTSYPAAHVGQAYVRGSGTSMAAAVTSGSAAAVLAVRPSLKPDDVKALFSGSTYGAAGLGERAGAGSGGLDLTGALDDLRKLRPGKGSSDEDVAPPEGDEDAWAALVEAFDDGDRAAAVKAWRSLSPASRNWVTRTWKNLDSASRSWGSRSWGSRSWGSGAWAGADGTADEWMSRYWASRSWGSRSWGSRSWGSDDWSSRSWGSRSWGSDDWSSRSWGSRSWGSDDWSSRSWGSRSWGSVGWAGEDWSSRSWGSRSWGSGVWSAFWR